MTKKKRPIGATITWLAMIFFYVPILFMVIFSFNSSKSLTNFTGFSLRWYQQMLQSHDMMNSLYITIAIAVLATIIATIIGTLSAIGLSYSKKLVKNYVNQINDLPMMNPDIVTAIGLMLLFITFHIERGFITLLLAHIAFCIPYVMLSITPKLRQLDPNLADAAMDLGATPFQTLTKVIVPEIMPGIVSGALIAFTMSFDDFIISYFATGNGVKNLSILVYTMAKRVNPSINAISTILVLLITIGMILMNVIPPILKKRQEEREKDPNYIPKPKNHTPRNILIGALILAIGIVGCFFFFRSKPSEHPFAGQTLHIYLPGEYISDEMIANFEEETGAKVVMDNFDSNEQMYIKVANNESFDVLIPSDYMVQRLIEEDLLLKLDPSKVDEALVQLDEAVLDLAYDPENQYSVPYFWGTVGIVYDTEKVDLDTLEKEGWGIFLDEDFKGDIYLYDSERDQFMTALKSLGYSMNTEDPDQLKEAYDWLVKSVQTMEPEIVTDEIIDNMANARKALGLVYSGDATYIIDENDQMDYFLPNEGTNVWVDAMCIPKTVANEDLAYAFINYAASYEAQMLNSLYVGYTATNEEVENELAQGEFDGISSYLPRVGYEQDEVFEYNEKTRKAIADYWSRVKIVNSNAR